MADTNTLPIMSNDQNIIGCDSRMMIETGRENVTLQHYLIPTEGLLELQLQFRLSNIVLYT